jgi:2'-hydroxyisoflavone reductase
MHVLILGGTVFLGRHVVGASLARGHDVTLFNRGQTRPELFPEVEKLRGDRDGDFGALAGRSFDAVVDTSGYVPRLVRATIDALGDVGHYTFVSTMSVYTERARAAGAREDDEVVRLEQETEEDTDESYGPLKALCEDVVRERFANAFVPRPGLIIGPWDPTGRFTYWPTRLAAGGSVLAPNPTDAPVQLIDARDLANWIVEAAEQDRSGTYNAISPPMTMVDVLETCRRVAGADAELVDQLHQHPARRHRAASPRQGCPTVAPRCGPRSVAEPFGRTRLEDAGLSIDPRECLRDPHLAGEPAELRCRRPGRVPTLSASDPVIQGPMRDPGDRGGDVQEDAFAEEADDRRLDLRRERDRAWRTASPFLGRAWSRALGSQRMGDPLVHRSVHVRAPLPAGVEMLRAREGEADP